MIRTTLKSVAIFGAILAMWQGLIWATDIPRFILPSPVAVGRVFIDSYALLAANTWITLLEIAAGLSFGVAFGIASGITLAQSEWAKGLARPILVITQSIPIFAIAPILTLWMGFGPASKITMAVLIIYFPVTSALFDGLTSTPKGFLDLARSMEATRSRLLWHIKFPAALPKLGSGLRLAAVYAPIGAIIGEWVGASRGLGYLMLLANGRGKPELMFAAVFILAVVSLALYLTTDRMLKRFGY
ncbi:MAG: ABC transporter permease [Pseudomonadota bacterium]